MTISVIIPFFHGNQYINSMLHVLKKNKDSLKEINVEMEIIFVNDSPGEKIVLSDEQRKINLITLENDQNVGIHKSRVNGLKHSHGNYIMFLDQDDIIDERCLFHHISNIQDSDFSISNGYILNQDLLKRPIYFSKMHHQRCLMKSFYYGYGNPIVSPGQVLLKRSAIPEQWMRYCLKNNGADDGYLWMLLLEENKKGIIIPDFLYTHVQTGSNTSLDIHGMCQSNREVISLLKGKASRFHLWLYSRRTQYRDSRHEKLFAKIKYLDVGIARKYYGGLKILCGFVKHMLHPT